MSFHHRISALVLHCGGSILFLILLRILGLRGNVLDLKGLNYRSLRVGSGKGVKLNEGEWSLGNLRVNGSGLI